MERKLVHVEKVKDVVPIDGADRIEIAKVLGWQCVTRKGEVKTGDLVAYFEIDSFIPIEPRFEFLRASSYKKMGDDEGFKLRTVKLRKQLSQGLVLPLSTFDELKNVHINEGMDLTGLLKVKLYEPPIPANLRGKIKGAFPSCIQKTDQERIQNLPDYFEKYKDALFEATEKIDGTSATFYLKQEIFGVCSRNWELSDSEGNTHWKVAKAIDIEKKLRLIGRNIAVQGEIIGESINGNPLNIKGQDFFVFDIWDIDARHYMTRDDRIAIIEKMNGIKHVPVIDATMPLFETCDEMLAYAESFSFINPKRQREGIVFKSLSIIDGNIVSFKAISNKYLLAEVQ